MDTIEKYLFDSTGMEWDLVLPIVMYFKTHYGPMRRLCVYSPDNPSNPFARYYIPKNADPLTLASPDDFLTKCLNLKKQLVDNPPTVKINLDSLPEITVIRRPQINMMIKYSWGYSGELVFRKISSVSRLELELISGLVLSSHIDLNAKSAIIDFISGFKLDPNLQSGEVSLKSSYTDEIGTTALTQEGNTFSAGFIPETNNIDLNFYGWAISGSIGYKVSGSIYPDGGSKTPPATAIEPEILDISLSKELTDKLGSLIIYTSDDNGGTVAPFFSPSTALLAF